jgi:FixJ family two-component response regulator
MMETFKSISDEVSNRHSLAGSFSWANGYAIGSTAADVPVVLIVDDVANNLLAFEGMLRRDDVEIVTALSGRAALDILLERDVALAIIDVQMPEMDGFELAALMRGVEKTRYVPIVFVTADSREQARMFKGYDVGAVDYLYKPVDQRVLCSKVAVFVTLAKQRQQLLQAERMQEMFVGILGHDLRNPLSAILMTAERLGRRSKDDAEREKLHQIILAGGRMARMIEQILDLTRIRLGGGLSLSSVPADLRGIVEQVVEESVEHKNRFSIEAVGNTHGSWDVDRISQVISNLAGNAIEHSPPGSPVLIRIDGSSDKILQLEVHNAGSGVPSELRDVLFEPFRGRERTRGLGLGLFVCKQVVIGHGGTIAYESSDDSGTCFRISLPRYTALEGSISHPGKGSAFATAAKLLPSEAGPQREPHRHGTGDKIVEEARPAKAILIVDDDPAVRDSLALVFEMDGYRVMAAADGDEAVALVARDGVLPDIVIVDYNLAKGESGPQVMARLRETSSHNLPAIILTGDITTSTWRNIALESCVQLRKPVKLEELTQAINRLLARPHSVPTALVPPSSEVPNSSGLPVITVVDDDSSVREGIRGWLEEKGHIVEDYATCEAFLEAYRPGHEACLLIDGYLPGMKGLELLQRLRDAGYRLPAIMITGSGDVPMAVQAMKSGASDFLEKPVDRNELLASIERALEQSRDSSKLPAWRREAADRIASLTPRQREIMEMVLAGHPNKNIAADLGLSQRTVENHRASIMKKTGSRDLPTLVKLALATARNGVDEPLVQLDFQPVAQRRGSG